MSIVKNEISIRGEFEKFFEQLMSYEENVCSDIEANYNDICFKTSCKDSFNRDTNYLMNLAVDAYDMKMYDFGLSYALQEICELFDDVNDELDTLSQKTGIRTSTICNILNSMADGLSFDEAFRNFNGEQSMIEWRLEAEIKSAQARLAIVKSTLDELSGCRDEVLKIDLSDLPF